MLEAHQAKLTFFKAATCQYLLERLVGHFMLLSEEVRATRHEPKPDPLFLSLCVQELQMWEAEPEEFGEFALCRK